MTYKVLDAFSCKGGSRQGFVDCGADVLSVDIVDYSAFHPPGQFIQADAVEFIRYEGHRFSLVSAGPPCQRKTRGNAPRRVNGDDHRHPELIAPTREACIAAGVPYVIENVEDAGWAMVDPVLLCGRMFDLHAYDDHPDARGMKLILDRHRLFEFGNMPRPEQPKHPAHGSTTGIGLRPSMWGEGTELIPDLVRNREARYLTGLPHVAGVYGGARRDPWEAKYIRRGGYVPKSLPVLQQLLGAPHIDTEKELFEAIPPAYTRWVFDQFVKGTS